MSGDWEILRIYEKPPNAVDRDQAAIDHMEQLRRGRTLHSRRRTYHEKAERVSMVDLLEAYNEEREEPKPRPYYALFQVVHIKLCKTSKKLKTGVQLITKRSKPDVSEMKDMTGYHVMVVFR
jgi:hypothetical protein